MTEEEKKKTETDKAQASIEKQNCTGQKCRDCLLCYKKDTTSIIVEKVKTYGKKKLQKILTNQKG